MNIELYNALMRLFEPTGNGIDPLKELPESTLTLYCYDKNFNQTFFNTQAKLDLYASNHPGGRKIIIDYLGKVAGKDNVIKETFENSKTRLLHYVSSENYEIYNSKRSAFKGTYMWDKYYGDVRSVKEALESNGINFDSDIIVYDNVIPFRKIAK